MDAKLAEMISVNPVAAAEMIKQLSAELVLEDFDAIDAAIKNMGPHTAWGYQIFNVLCAIVAAEARG